MAMRNKTSEINGDRTWTAADVQDCHVRLNMGNNIAGGVGSGAPAVSAEDRRGVVCCVG